ncbi:hypothetical protein [Microbacterium sp. MYb62]|uniref:hypothetical protein n=1 Tax=Microbacterium sp. MYb62 TaxID=1848690 RepID=UPI0011B05B18
MVMISDRLAEVDDGSAIATLVERTSRFTTLVHLPDDHGTIILGDALARTLQRLPAHLRRSLTWVWGQHSIALRSRRSGGTENRPPVVTASAREGL